MSTSLTPELLLNAYASGVFPMAESRRHTELFWVDPKHRGIFELDRFHISRSLKRCIRRDSFQIRTNTAFLAVVKGCADRTDTWINDQLLDLYEDLHSRGFAHSVEVWDDELLVGGVYGLAIGGAFFGESMFSRRTDASKVALVYLVDRLRQGGFTLFDTQFITPHLASLGAIEIPRADYQNRLKDAINIDADFWRVGDDQTAYSVLQRNTQTS